MNLHDYDMYNTISGPNIPTASVWLIWCFIVHFILIIVYNHVMLPHSSVVVYPLHCVWLKNGYAKGGRCEAYTTRPSSSTDTSEFSSLWTTTKRSSVNISSIEMVAFGICTFTETSFPSDTPKKSTRSIYFFPVTQLNVARDYCLLYKLIPLFYSSVMWCLLNEVVYNYRTCNG